MLIGMSLPYNPQDTLLQRSGLVIVHKPAGMTSHDVVSRLRRIYKTKRVGHSGTLDPMATGVLVLGIERGTKFLAHLVTHDKRYSARMILGASTVTDDREGEILTQASPEAIKNLTYEGIEQALLSQRGSIMQRPTRVSSIKINGRRAHELVREGVEFSLPERPVEIFSLDITGHQYADDSQNNLSPHSLLPPEHHWGIDFDVHCSSGTYVRAIARDAGESLGVGGYLSALERTTVGPFSIREAHTLEELEEKPVLSMNLDQALGHCFTHRIISDEEAHDLSLGKWLSPQGIPGLYAAITEEGKGIALLEEKGKRAASVFLARPATLA